jgi:hypothetical protein
MGNPPDTAVAPTPSRVAKTPSCWSANRASDAAGLLYDVVFSSGAGRLLFGMSLWMSAPVGRPTRARLRAMRWFALGMVLAGVACGPAPDAPSAPAPPPLTRPVASKLPVLSLRTADGLPVTSKETYVAGAFTLTDTVGGTLSQGPLEVRGRGFSTWTMPKKPYRLKLTAANPLLGMPANRHWVLLANYSDKTLIRNDVAFEFSRLVGMEYTPRSHFVDLQLNGNYEGIYQLTEHVRIAPERVNVPELKASDTTATTITGGYLIEVDERRGEDFCFSSTRTPMVFCLVNPETLNDPGWAKQRAYILAYMRQLDETIFGPQFADPTLGYAAYIDVESMIGYYLVNELFKNVDGNLRLSTFLYKKRGGKLTFGPVWDFDLAIGNVNYLNADKPEGWYIRTAPWFNRLFQDPAFSARVRTRWNQMVADGTLTRLVDYIRLRKSYLSVVQERNFTRWPILNLWVWPNRVVTGSYDGEGLAMQDWLATRRAWLDAQFR